MNMLEENSTETVSLLDTPLTRNIKFGLFVALAPLSLVCNIVLVYYLIRDGTLRRTLHNHGILSLLIATLVTNLVDVPRVINHFRVGIVIPQSEMNCLFWQWYSFSLYGIVNLLMLWLSIERYLIIFHGNIHNTMRRRLWCHYFPFILIVVYMPSFYMFLIFIYPCDEQFDFNTALCGYPCFMGHLGTSLYDLTVHTWIPLFFGILVDSCLVIRVIYRKRVGLQHQNAHHRRHRKMIIQVLSISTLYSIIQTPCSAVFLGQLFIVFPDWIIYAQNVYFYYFFWLLTLLLPFVCMACIPEVITKIKNQFIRRTRRNVTVLPMVTIALTNRTRQ